MKMNYTLNVFVDVLETVSILLVVDIWTVEMSTDEGKYSKKKTVYSLVARGYIFRPTLYCYKTLCLIHDQDGDFLKISISNLNTCHIVFAEFR